MDEVVTPNSLGTIVPYSTAADASLLQAFKPTYFTTEALYHGANVARTEVFKRSCKLPHRGGSYLLGYIGLEWLTGISMDAGSALVGWEVASHAAHAYGRDFLHGSLALIGGLAAYAAGKAVAFGMTRFQRRHELSDIALQE